MINYSILALSFLVAFVVSIFLLKKIANFLLVKYFHIRKDSLKNSSLAKHLTSFICCSLTLAVYSNYILPYLMNYCNENPTSGFNFLSKLLNVANTVLIVLVCISITLLLFSILNVALDACKKSSKTHKKSRNAGNYADNLTFVVFYAKIIKIVLLIFSLLAIISIVFNISFWSCLTSIGAATAIITLVFKDAILGMFAGLVLTLEGIVVIGDTVNVPQYSIIGAVENIDSMFVTIRNSDDTTSTIPTYNFMMANIIKLKSIQQSDSNITTFQ